MRVVDSVLDLIGNTPMVKLNRVTNEGMADVYVKCENLNPSGSLKDRIVLEMIREAEAEGKLKPGYTIIEASTGNTGTAVSFVGGYLGYKVEIYMPEGMTLERIRLMECYGAEVHQLELESISEDESVAGAEVEIGTRQRCLELERTRPKTWWARQFSNPANTRAHYKTGLEIYYQMEGRVDAFVASIGVGGTLYGVAKALKGENPDVRIVGVEPASANYPISEGHYRMPGFSDEITGGIIEEMMESGIVDEVVKVTNRNAIEMSDRLVKEEGLFCGISSGANVYHALKVAAEMGPGRRVATVLPDNRDRYLSEKKYTT
ncbi:PLP-dependent cysteine synthase family protein [Candidatus Bathyarchaeota archaeon]|nr:PLP-dependent cysteine synthase family protein [Candidatus Bathyarchaeota archaeon]MBL7080724.1 PLP-dependent cysteine synthase family protein [Candidatus Bathyarchaeota archaeon]